jgi:diacylglycerol kinase family enzyme
MPRPLPIPNERSGYAHWLPALPGIDQLACTVDESRADDMVRLDGVRELSVDSHGSHLTLALDGETVALAPPLTFRIRPKTLRVIVPS